MQVSTNNVTLSPMMECWVDPANGSGRVEFGSTQIYPDLNYQQPNPTQIINTRTQP